MQFHDSETQRLLRTTAKSFLANAYPIERLYRIESGADAMTEAGLREIEALGWFELLLPEANGDATEAESSAASLLDAAAVIEEIGYAGVPSPVPAANVAAYVLSKTSTPLPPGGSLSSSEAKEGAGREGGLTVISEGARLQTNKPTITITNGSVATGTLPLVPFADLSECVLAPATVDGQPALVVLPLSGAQLQPLELMDRRCYSNVRFDNASAEVVAIGADAAKLSEQLDALSTAFGVVEMAGLMQRILEMTTEHVTTRQQFGQPIGKFQAARHRAADILVQLDTTRWAAYHALWLFQNDPSRTDEIYLAKHWAVRASDRVFQHTHMLHGGVGVGMEHPLHLFTQGMAALAVRGGTMSEMVNRTLAYLKTA